MTNARRNRIGLVTGLLAIPVWILIAIEVPLRSSRPDRHVIGPIVLCGLTVALQRVLRTSQNAWPFSAFIAGLVTLAVVLWSAG
jgi:hypothetical protein